MAEDAPTSRDDASSLKTLDPVSIISRFWRGREDWHAEQIGEWINWVDKAGRKRQIAPGGYLKKRGGITPQMLVGHLRGDVTLGQYQISSSGHVYWMCQDLDNEETSAAELLIVQSILDQLGIKTEIEYSSPERIHAWILLSEPLEAEVAYRFGLQLKARLITTALPWVEDILRLGSAPDAAQRSEWDSLSRREFFPKQAARGDGWGNLVRLPLGLHRAKKVWSTIPNLRTELSVNSSLRIAMALRKMERQIPNPLAILKPRNPALNISQRSITLPRGQRREDFIKRIERANQAATIQQVVSAALGIPLMSPGDKIVCPFHGPETGSSCAPAFQVGGSIAQNVAFCWSSNCRLAGVKLTRFRFLQELTSDQDGGRVLALLERLSGIS
jgi:hypothetical protein